MCVRVPDVCSLGKPRQVSVFAMKAKALSKFVRLLEFGDISSLKGKEVTLLISTMYARP